MGCDPQALGGAQRRRGNGRRRGAQGVGEVGGDGGVAEPGRSRRGDPGGGQTGQGGGRLLAQGEARGWRRAAGPEPPALTRCRKLRRSRSSGVVAMTPVIFRPRPASTPLTNRLRGAGPEADFSKQFASEPIQSPRPKTDKATS